jgi:hypothetical protein
MGTIQPSVRDTGVPTLGPWRVAVIADPAARRWSSSRNKPRQTSRIRPSTLCVPRCGLDPGSARQAIHPEPSVGRAEFGGRGLLARPGHRLDGRLVAWKRPIASGLSGPDDGPSRAVGGAGPLSCPASAGGRNLGPSHATNEPESSGIGRRRVVRARPVDGFIPSRAWGGMSSADEEASATRRPSGPSICSVRKTDSRSLSRVPGRSTLNRRLSTRDACPGPGRVAFVAPRKTNGHLCTADEAGERSRTQFHPGPRSVRESWRTRTCPKALGGREARRLSCWVRHLPQTSARNRATPTARRDGVVE